MSVCSLSVPYYLQFNKAIHSIPWQKYLIQKKQRQI